MFQSREILTGLALTVHMDGRVAQKLFSKLHFLRRISFHRKNHTQRVSKYKFASSQNNFLSSYSVIVFSHLSLHPLLPSTKSRGLHRFTTATNPSLGHFEKLEFPLSKHLLAANRKLVETFQTSSEYSL